MKRANTLLLVFLLLCSAPVLHADHAVNINTSTLEELDSLPGIGPALAQRIVDYRTGPDGPFNTKEELMEVSGIGASTFADLEDHITVGTVAPPEEVVEEEEEQEVTPPVVQSTSVSAGPPPITTHITAKETVAAGAHALFEAAAYGTKGEPLGVGVRYVWNFGDGTTAEGQQVYHAYAYPGRYAVQLSTSYHYSAAVARMYVVAAAAQVALAAEGDGSLTVINRSSSELGVGLWQLEDAGNIFTIPEDTVVLGGEGVRFAPAVLGFNGTTGASLRYPDGAVAASAKVAAASPLRGARVTASELQAAPTPAAAPQTGAVLGAYDTEALPAQVYQAPLVAAAQAASSNANAAWLWSSVVALLAVLVLAVSAVWYARRLLPEPDMPEDEFEIEER